MLILFLRHAIICFSKFRINKKAIEQDYKKGVLLEALNMTRKNIVETESLFFTEESKDIEST